MQYHVHDLVYYESTSDVNGAITREKQLKKWERASKIRLIEESNPHWETLYPQLGQALPADSRLSRSGPGFPLRRE